MIKVGDKLPAGSLLEFIEVEGDGCSLGPNSFDIEKSTAGKTVAIFALPGAFTPTCSAQHVPGYVQKADELKAAGVDEIWCVSVNYAFVMGAWGRDQKTAYEIMPSLVGSEMCIRDRAPTASTSRRPRPARPSPSSAFPAPTRRPAPVSYTHLTLPTKRIV